MSSSATATFVFTDLVGSTAMMSRLGEAAADEVRREHFGLLRAAVASHGGREVKNLGDGLMVVFDGVTSALSCAVAMQQGIAGRPSDREPLAIRVGVAVGEAELDDGDYFGLPVVEAARLCAKADAGEILTTEFVRMLARSRSEIELESVGALDLKGLEEPVDAYRVCWSPIDVREDRAPLPSRLVAALSQTFVGRDEEREQLLTAWKEVVGGQCRLMFLSGEPGIGKTTLAAEFAAQVYEQGALLVYGRCDEDLGVPYQPWVEALGQLVTQLPEPILAAHVAERGAHLARLVPQLATRLAVEVPSSADGDTERFVLYGCVTDLLMRAAADQPVLLVLDDLHWADAATVQLLRNVAVADQPTRVGVVATFRDSDIGVDHSLTELLAFLHRQGNTERFPLPGLDDQALLALLERVAGHEMDDQGIGLRNALLAETAGNPFFVVEILRHLVQSHTLYQRDGRWVSDTDIHEAGLPVSVREVIGRRVATLGPDTERLLILASVIGRDFDISLLAQVADFDEEHVIDQCDAAVHASVLQATSDPNRYMFAHALIEHTLYDSLSPARRARAHRNVAEHLEHAFDADRRVGELAYHWGAAVQPTDTPKAVHYAQLAGDRALQQLAPDEAIRWYTQALELFGPDGDPSRRARILVGLGEAQRDDGRLEFRATLLEAASLADKSNDVELLVRAAIANNRGWYSAIGGTDEDRIAIINRALQRIDPAASADRAQLLALAAVESVFSRPLTERVALCEAAIAAARASGDQNALIRVLGAAVAVTHPSTLRLRTDWLEDACALADARDDRAAQAIAHLAAMLPAWERADLDATLRHLSDAELALEQAPVASYRWLAYEEASQNAIIAGDLIEAERLAEAAFTYGTENGQPDALTIYGGTLVNIRHHQGRFSENIPLIEMGIAASPGLPVFEASLIYPLGRAGETQRAATLLDTHLASGLQIPEDNLWATAYAGWADAAVLLGNVAAAQLIRDRIVPFADHIPASGGTMLPVLANYLGKIDHLLGDHDEAEQWFEKALAIHERLESPLFVAYTQAAWAALLIDRTSGDDHDRARTLAQAALDAATAGGYGAIEVDARAVLDRLS